MIFCSQSQRKIRLLKLFPEMGFRPFFLAMAGWAVVAMLLFTLGAHGDIAIASHLGLYRWHAHEMLFGFVGAAIAGFLLTAVPNWTGGRPLAGVPLLGLLGLWLAGRIAMAFSDSLGPVASAVIDLSFWISLTSVILFKIAAYRNLRNVPIIIALLLVSVSAIGSHLSGMGIILTDWPLRLGIGTIVLLICLIGDGDRVLVAPVQSSQPGAGDSLICRRRKRQGAYGFRQPRCMPRDQLVGRIEETA